MTDRINPKSIGFFTGLFFFSLTLCTTPPAGLTIEAWHVAGVVIMMAFWWATEAISLQVTALLPLALFPLLQVYGPYVNDLNPKEPFPTAAKP